VHVQRLREIGAWLKVNGESIYGTRVGVIPPTKETVSTRRGDTHYVHVLDYVSDCVRLEGVPENLTHARLLRDGQDIPLERRDGVTILTIPAERRDAVDTVVELS
jgi:alpha-L-fucosidase